MELLTEEEVKNYIYSQYEYLNLTQSEFDQYVKFILKIDHNRKYNKKPQASAFDYFEAKFNQVYDLFLQEGCSQEESLNLTKKDVLNADRKEYITKHNLFRVLNFEKGIINRGLWYHNTSIESMHARKCYLVETNGTKYQTAEILVHISDKKFETKFSVNIANLAKKYPITEELINVWAYLAKFKEDELLSEFKLTREELAMIYPTNKEQVAVLKTIASLSDVEISNRYGISRQQLLQKHPLNKDTLVALKAIQTASEAKIENLFQKSKSDVLKLRTITTEMIQLANRQIKLKKQGTYSKEEFREKLKSMKKGAM